MNRIRLQEFLEAKLGVPDSVTGADVNYICPFCLEDGSHHHLHVNYDKGEMGVAICHSCSYKAGSLVSLLRELHGGVLPRSIEKAAARQKLSGLATKVRELFNGEITGPVIQPLGLPKGFRRLPYKDDGAEGGKILRYLIRERGYTTKVIDQFGLGYVKKKSSEAYGCLIFPFLMNSQCMYWQGRRVFGSGPKYHNPSSTAKKHVIFGYDQGAQEKRKFIGEGCFDGMAWGPGGLSTTGIFLQPQQIRAIALQDPEEVVFGFDGSKWDKSKERMTEDATDKAWAAAKEFKKQVRNCRVGVCKMPGGDPDENKHKLKNLVECHTRWMNSGFKSKMTYLLEKW